MVHQQKFDPQKVIPKHVAIIMDGNGRWAQERNLARTAGHREGLNAIKRVCKAAVQVGVKVLTIYAFSTENWKRPKKEVSFLMNLPSVLNDDILPELVSNNIQVQMLGSRQGLPKKTLRAIDRAIEQTKQNSGLILNVAFNYGSRQEITEACQILAKEVEAGQLKAENITEEKLDACLRTASLGEYRNPDLLIRSSGEVRLSNYLLWQLAYAEMLFVEEKWPDFDEEIFLQCLAVYQQRDRRFGKIKS